MAIRWLLHAIIDGVTSIDTEREYVVFHCSNDHGEKYCSTWGILIDSQVATILILKLFNLVFEYG